jgi:photosystem II stability/assembly factor-like uncharacterized protein
VATNLILYGIDFPADQDDIGYAGGSSVTYNGKGTILKTLDQGDTWNVIWSSTVNGTGVCSMYFLNVDTGFVGTQGGAVMRTTDGGANWTSVDLDTNNDQGDVHDVTFRDADHGVVVTAYNGVYRTVDGGATWVPATTNPAVGQFEVCYAGGSTLFSCGNNQSIYKSVDDGDTWTSSYQGLFQTVSLGIHFLDANNGMVTSEEGMYFKTTNGGATWTAGTILNQFGLMRGVVMLDANNIFVCATPGQVFRTVDGGANWTDDSGVNPNPSYYDITFTPNGTGFVSGSGATGGTILKRSPLSTAVEDREVPFHSVMVYPNPVAEVLTVECATEVSGPVDVRLINGLGALVMTKQVASTADGRMLTQLDVSQVAPGLYTIDLVGRGGVRVSRHISVVGR